MSNLPRIIAVDFDGCLFTNKWPDIGDPIEKNIAKLKEEQTNGAKIILWTSRTGVRLTEALVACAEQDVCFDAVNENIPAVTYTFDSDCRKIFAHEYWDDRAVLMNEKDPCARKKPVEDSNIMRWAEREIEIAKKHERTTNENAHEEDWDYACACYDSALKALRSLSQDGHSGFSIHLTKHILVRLIEGKPLVPIEDTPDIWNGIIDRNDEGGYTTYQCSRMSSLFKDVYDDGRVIYNDVDRVSAIDLDTDSSCHSGQVSRIIDEMFPIIMPYMPTDKPFKVYFRDCLVDPKKGDYDTRAILYAIKPDGGEVQINRYFMEDDDRKWVEI